MSWSDSSCLVVYTACSLKENLGGQIPLIFGWLVFLVSGMEALLLKDMRQALIVQMSSSVSFCSSLLCLDDVRKLLILLGKLLLCQVFHSTWV